MDKSIGREKKASRLVLDDVQVTKQEICHPFNCVGKLNLVKYFGTHEMKYCLGAHSCVRIQE
jgi:hypothetical protein